MYVTESNPYYFNGWSVETFRLWLTTLLCFVRVLCIPLKTDFSFLVLTFFPSRSSYPISFVPPFLFPTRLTFTSIILLPFTFYFLLFFFFISLTANLTSFCHLETGFWLILLFLLLHVLHKCKELCGTRFGINVAISVEKNYRKVWSVYKHSLNMLTNFFFQKCSPSLLFPKLVF